jgi:hypothetical protein
MKKQQKDGGGASIPPQELRRIVEAYGGPEAFAPLIGVKLRFLYYLLAGKRRMSPRTEMLVRKLDGPTDSPNLKAAKPKKRKARI